MTVTLQEITIENWRQATDLKVAEEQDNYVAPNVYSIAQSQFYPSWVPLGVYDDETMVGFIMVGEAGDHPGNFWVIRLMIDASQQGKGYGRAAMLEAIKRIKAEPTVQGIYTSYVQGNVVAASLYASLGFAETGEVHDDEVTVKLNETLA